jgi:hypothetical protein
MPQLISIGAAFPWLRASTADRYHGKSANEIDQELADLSCNLWRGAGVTVPEPATAGTAWLMAGQFLYGIGLLSALCLVASGFSLFILIATNRPDSAVIALLLASVAAAATVLTLPGTVMIDHAKRLLVRVPLDLSASVTSARDPRGGRMLKLLAITLGAVSLLVALVGGFAILLGNPTARMQLPMLPPVPMPIAWVLIVLTFGIGSVAGAISLFRRGQAMLQPSADELLARDRRRPVVLLRSFGDEDLALVAGQTHGHNVRLARLEEAVADRFRPFGPLVAIGNPRETLPRLGAARSYHSEMEWRWAVIGLMREALLIVVIAGLTAGLRWELEAIARDGHLWKLLILMPQSDQERRWQVIRQELQGLSVPGMPRLVPHGLLCLHATRDGDWAMLTAARGWEADYETAIDHAIQGMFCH